MELADEHGPSQSAAPPEAANFKSSPQAFFFLLFSPTSISTSTLLTMESLSDTQWDVVISGTGLQQSLLAL